MSMRFFDEFDVMQLQEVAEDLQWDEAELLRVTDSDYAVLGRVPCRLFPPGTMRGEYKSLVPHLRGMALGEIEVSVDDGDRYSITEKDRLRVTTQGNRIFEVAGAQNPRTIEIRRKLIIREINLPERELYLALKRSGYDGATNEEAEPELIRVLPVPLIIDKQTDAVAESHEGRGIEIARLKQLMVSEVAIDYFRDENRAKLLYCLVVLSDTTPTTQQADAGVFTRYTFNGLPSFENNRWAKGVYPWSVSLVEHR